MTEYKIAGHEPPRKPIDLRGRRRVITLEDVQNGVVREPDPAAYSYSFGVWVLKE